MKTKIHKITILKETAGFTIIELLISTIIFSVILLILSFSVIAITRTYYKGIIESQTQNVTRNASNEITQAVQFGTSAPVTHPLSATTGVICIGSQAYAYSIGVQLTTANKVLRSYTFSQSCSGSPADFATINANGKELLSPHMRLANFSVKTTAQVDLFQVIVRIVYGDNDLICSPTTGVPGNCNSETVNGPLAAPDLNCKSFTGSQFCAESDLNTFVQRRLVGLQLMRLGA